VEAGSPDTPAVCRGAAHWSRSWGTPGQGAMPLETYTTFINLHEIRNLITSTIDIAGAHSKTVAGTKTKDP